MTKSLDEIRQAFISDSFEPQKPEAFYGSYKGVIAYYKPDPNAPADSRKRAIYVEGDNYAMGYMIGQLLEPQVSRMTTEYVNSVIPQLIDQPTGGLLFELLRDGLEAICLHLYGSPPKDIPGYLVQEMKGIVAGCQAANIKTKVTFENVLMLNVGIDILVSLIYTLDGLDSVLNTIPLAAAWLTPAYRAAAKGLPKGTFRAPPIACNAFSAFGEATVGRKFYFGRDFQFPAHGGFEDCACLIIYNPIGEVEGLGQARPLVVQATPGMVGCATAMSDARIGIGVNVAISANCNPQRPGLNSLLMVRHAAHFGTSAQQVVDVMTSSQRGVSWIYPVGDGGNNQAVMVEAGMSVNNLQFMNYPFSQLISGHLLPTGAWKPIPKGLYPRWNKPAEPDRFLASDQGLFAFMGYTNADPLFERTGEFNSNWRANDTSNIDDGFYFHPQRTNGLDLLVATNIYLMPEMRLCAMNEWSNYLAKSRMADFIWRYDTLNKLCQDRLNSTGPIDEPTALDLIDFLRPGGPFPKYSQECGTQDVVGGSISLCNLTDLTMTSRFGRQGDPWLKIELPKYIS